jgi:hypothetical protein
VRNPIKGTDIDMSIMCYEEHRRALQSEVLLSKVFHEDPWYAQRRSGWILLQ